MEIILRPPEAEWDSLLVRPQMDHTLLERQVAETLADIRVNGDQAIRKYSLEFDGVDLDDFVVPADQVEEAADKLTPELKAAIRQAAANIKAFHSRQLEDSGRMETMAGITCWHRYAPIERVGLYIPGGSAPLFSTLLMLGIPAKLAGCPQISLCTPPGKDGKVHPAILYTAKLVGLSRIYRIGGIQAIGAMAFGTSSMPRVYKIFGPGNQYVACAKHLVNIAGTAIDIPAGPSEVAILADDSAVPRFVAADLLAQAEHGADSQVLLVTCSEHLALEVKGLLAQQATGLPREQTILQALAHSKAIVMASIDQAIALVNAYAPEHLIINCREDEQIALRIDNAGSIFLGNFSPESAGDYATGPNHTLPTNGYARLYSGVSVDSFVKRITLQKLTPEGFRLIAPTVEVMAAAEGLEAHRRSILIRLDAQQSQNPKN